MVAAEGGGGGLGGGGTENLGRLPLLFLLHASELESGFDDDDGDFLEDPDSDCFAFLLPALNGQCFFLFLMASSIFFSLLSLSFFLLQLLLLPPL